MSNVENTNSTPNTSTHLDWVDVAKGYGILLVMLGHLEPGILEPYIYSFHVPLFFFLSGYVFNDKRSFGEFLLKKCKGILLPYFSFGLIIIAFQRIHGEVSDSADFTFSLLKSQLTDLLIQKRCWDLWFISCLFLVDIIFYLMVKLFRNQFLILAVSIALIPLGLHLYKTSNYNLSWNYWNIDVCFFAILFFALGYVSRNGFLISLMELFKKKHLSIAFFVIFALANIILGTISYRTSGNFLEMYMGTYGIPGLAIPAAIFGILATVIFSQWFTLRGIKYIGMNSLLYYAFHQNIALPLVRDLLLILKIDGSSLKAAGSVNCFIFCIIFEMLGMLLLLYIISILFNKTKLKILLGK